jgi:hypothetical protein
MPSMILSLPDTAAARADLGAETLRFVEGLPFWQRMLLHILVVIVIMAVNIGLVYTAWPLMLLCLWKRARERIAPVWQIAMMLILAFW